MHIQWFANLVSISVLLQLLCGFATAETQVGPVFPYAQYEDEDGIITIDSDELYNSVLKSTNSITTHYTLVYLTQENCELCDLFESKVLRKVSQYVHANYNTNTDEDSNDYVDDDNNDDEDDDNNSNEMAAVQGDRHRAVFAKLLSDRFSGHDDLVEKFGTQYPKLLIFPPSINAVKKSQIFEFLSSEYQEYKIESLLENVAQVNQEVYQFAEHLGNILKIYIQLEEYFDSTKFLKQFIMLLCAFVLIKKRVYPGMKENFLKKTMLIISLLIIYSSCTGYSFVRTNDIVMIARDGEGQIMWFSGGMGWQFGIETLSVSGMYVAMGGIVYVLIRAVQHIDTVTETVLVLKECTVVLACVVLLWYTTQYFESCFKIKFPNYM